MFNIWTHINTLNTTVNHFYIVNPTVCYSISNIFSLWARQQKNLCSEYFRKFIYVHFIKLSGFCAHKLCVLKTNTHTNERQSKGNRSNNDTQSSTWITHHWNICHRLFWNIIGIPLWVYACGGVQKWMCAMSTTTTDCCAFAWDSQSFRWFFFLPSHLSAAVSLH